MHWSGGYRIRPLRHRLLLRLLCPRLCVASIPCPDCVACVGPMRVRWTVYVPVCVCVCVCACLCVRVCLLLTIHCVMSGAPFSDCNFSSSGIFWDFPLLVSLIHPSPNPHTPQPTPNISLTPEFGTGNVSASRLPLPYTKLNPTLN